MRVHVHVECEKIWETFTTYDKIPKQFRDFEYFQQYTKSRITKPKLHNSYNKWFIGGFSLKFGVPIVSCFKSEYLHCSIALNVIKCGPKRSRNKKH